jgi:hypothetical protein
MKDVAPMFSLDVGDGRQRSLALRSDGASSPADELQWRWCCCVQQPTFEVLKGVDLQWYLLCAGDAVSPSFSSPAVMPTAAEAEIAIGRVVDALKDPKGSLCIFTFSRGLCAISYVCCHLDISRGGHVCCNLKV